MNEIEALLLGVVQGLTEFLPVSSSGHLEIGHALLGIHTSGNLLFAITVHVATVCSTLVVFRKEIWQLLKELMVFKWNPSSQYVAKLLLSSVPVVIVGLFFRAEIEQFFTGNLFFVGSMLMVTALLLGLSSIVKTKNKEITFVKSLIIGVAQAAAVLPGISRSGATIATGLLLNSKKDEMARFSFLMVLIPILGAAFLDVAGGEISSERTIGTGPLIAGFAAAFISGIAACSWMIRIVKSGKLIYFSIYCLVIGIIALLAA